MRQNLGKGPSCRHGRFSIVPWCWRWWGTLVASTVTAQWQRRSRRQDLRIQHIRDLLDTYHEYIRILKSTDGTLGGRDFDLVHAKLFSLGKMSAVIFDDPRIETLWKGVAQAMATLRDLKLKGKGADFEERLREVCFQGELATNSMLEEVL